MESNLCIAFNLMGNLEICCFFFIYFQWFCCCWIGFYGITPPILSACECHSIASFHRTSAHVRLIFHQANVFISLFNAKTIRLRQITKLMDTNKRFICFRMVYYLVVCNISIYINVIYAFPGSIFFSTENGPYIHT